MAPNVAVDSAAASGLELYYLEYTPEPASGADIKAKERLPRLASAGDA